MSVFAQVAHREVAPESMQRMIGMSHGYEINVHQQLATHTRRYSRRDRKVGGSRNQDFRGPADHGLEPLDVSVRTFKAEAIQAVEHEPRGKEHFNRESDFGLPPRGDFARRTF